VKAPPPASPELIEAYNRMVERDKVLLETSARVHSVDEEGNVRLFCYRLDTSFNFNVGFSGAKEWAARIGDCITIRVTAEIFEEPKVKP
jgi:hypothetical protein